MNISQINCIAKELTGSYTIVTFAIHDLRMKISIIFILRISSMKLGKERVKYGLNFYQTYVNLSLTSTIASIVSFLLCVLFRNALGIFDIICWGATPTFVFKFDIWEATDDFTERPSPPSFWLGSARKH